MLYMQGVGGLGCTQHQGQSTEWQNQESEPRLCFCDHSFQRKPNPEGISGAPPPRGETWNKKDLVHWLPGPFQTHL